MRAVQDYRASGNEYVVATLEKWLTRAKEGQLRYIAICACGGPTHVEVEHAGSAGCEFAANFGFDLLKQHCLGNKRAGGLSGGPGYDYAVYDLARAPVGWDFGSWLVEREQERIRHKSPAPLKVAFKGDISGRLWTEAQTQMLEKVMRPLVRLIGAVEDIKALEAPVRSEFYCLKFVTEAARRGEPVPMFKPPAEWMSRARPGHVTITLREAEHSPHRNANMAAWARLARELRRRGESVIIVRDTAAAEEPFEDFAICPEASTDLGARCALYAAAKCNLFMSNGPWWLGLFGDRPWLAFVPVDPNDPFEANKPEMWHDFHGIHPGEQFPWSRPDQRIIWKADDYETLIAAWDELEPLLQGAQRLEAAE